jgi:tRNA (cytidine/uridine-2'-O-)-methyltransferase
MGEPKSSPQKSNRSGSLTGWETALMAGIMAQASHFVPRPKMFNVVLFQPEIPPNTGNVIRLCANTGSTLHLVRPLGFDIQDKAVRRAGLDYDELAQVRVHASLDACLSELAGARVFCVETGGTRIYSAAAFEPGDVLMFGPETRGLPASVLDRIPADQQLSIPMRPGNRSINLSNTVALVVYEAWRQQGFASAGATSS